MIKDRFFQIFQKKHKAHKVQKYLLYFLVLPFTLLALGWFIPPLYVYLRATTGHDIVYEWGTTIFGDPFRKRAVETAVALEDGAPVTITQVQVPMPGTAAIPRPTPLTSTHGPTPAVTNPADAGPTAMAEPSPTDNSEPLHQLYKRRRGGGGSYGGGYGGDVKRMTPVPSVSVAGVVWTSLIILYLLVLPLYSENHTYHSMRDSLLALTFFWGVGLGVMIAASLLVNPKGARYMGACLLAFGWILVIALTVTLLWNIIYALRFHKGYMMYSIASLEKAREESPAGTPPAVPAKDEPNLASPPLAYAQPPSGFPQQANFHPAMSAPQGYAQSALVSQPQGYLPQQPGSPTSGFNVPPGTLPPDSHSPVQPMPQGYGYQSPQMSPPMSPQMSGQVGQQAYPQPQHNWVTTQGPPHRPTEIQGNV
ncbi:hypothetical protein CcaverHIS002_0608010 [Cutaneotrichosporon cavernicola]|nr:hypothetical protein CcaverHIS002_0608010 [Cutaneotrichosporon cavernicola]